LQLVFGQQVTSLHFLLGLFVEAISLLRVTDGLVARIATLVEGELCVSQTVE
jgi:hypothetical protein